MEDFKIKGKVEIDSKEYQAFLKSKEKLEKLQNRINKENEKIQKEKIRDLKKEIELLREKDKIEKKDYSAKIKAKETKLKELQTQQKLNKAQKEYQRAQEEFNRKLKADEKVLEIKNNLVNLQRQRELRSLSMGPRDTARLAGQIQRWGKGGFFEFLADQEQIKGIKTLDNITDAGEKEKLAIEESFNRGELSEEEKNKKLREVKNNTETKKAAAQGQTKANISKYQAMAVAAQKIAGQLEAVGKKIASVVLKPFKQLAEAITGAVKAMLEFKSGVATYNTSSSLITNAAAREQQIKYGLTSDKNYGFTRAKEMLNIQSDEDLMYMNKDQRDRLLQYMDRYSKWYSEIESSGVLASIQEMQLEFNELKEELAMDFLQWVAENKDTIMACIKGIFEFIKWIANLIVDIVQLFGGKTKNYDLYDAAKASDTYNSNNNSKNTQINMNINTTNNATGVLGSQDALDKFNEENWSQLAKQVVGVIGG